MRIHYWNKEKKKNIYKTVSLKKFDGDENKAREFLENWKAEQIQKQQKEEIKEEIQAEAGRAVAQAIEEIQEEIKEEIQEPIIEPIIEPIKEEKIKYEPFKLSLSNPKETGSSTVIFGASKSGKTHLMKEILKKYYDNENYIIILMADNVHANIYKDLNKNVIKADKFYPELVKQLHKIQKKTDNKYHFLLVLDDMVMEKSDPQLLKMFLTYRNSKISTIILLQSLSLLSKNARFNGNNFIFKKCNSQQYIDDVMKYFLGGYGVFANKKINEQTQLFRDITNNYGFVYLDALNDSISYHK